MQTVNKILRKKEKSLELFVEMIVRHTFINCFFYPIQEVHMRGIIKMYAHLLRLIRVHR